MGVLANTETGMLEDVPEQHIQKAIQSGTHQYPLVDPQGNKVVVGAQEAPELMAQGYRQPTTEELSSGLEKAKYNTTEEQVKSFASGAGKSATFGLSTALEDPEAHRLREKYNPGLTTAGEITGLVGTSFIPGFGEAAAAKEAGLAARAAVKAGQITEEAAAPIIAKAAQSINPLSAQSIMSGLGERAAAKLGTGPLSSAAIKGLVENAIFQGGDEVSKMISNDPDQTVGTAATNIGLGGILGAGVGGAFGAVHPLWEATQGSKLSQFIEDFKGRLKEHIDNPDPINAVKDELQNHFSGMMDATGEVYGENGIKGKVVQSHLPEMGPKIESQMSEVSTKANDAIKKLGDDPYASKLKSAFNKFTKEVSPSVDPVTGESLSRPTSEAVFNAADDFKKQLQEWGKYNKAFVPLAEKDFRDVAKDLAREVRLSLEDSNVWGKAADSQKEINKAFSEYFPTFKDFTKKFTTEIGGEKMIDPGKVQTYMNQLGKPNAEVKQQVMENFLRESENYRKVIDDAHKKIGIESPFQGSSLNAVKNTLNEISPGAKAADALVKRGLAKTGGQGLGALIGGGVGHMFGAGGFGAIIGEHSLGPLFESVLPSLVKPILENGSSTSGMKGAIDLGMAAAKGESNIIKASKSLFNASKEVLPSKLIPDDKSRSNLDKKLKDLQSNNSSLLDVGGNIGHYLPNHGSAMSQTALRASQYLNSIRPHPPQGGPLDSGFEVSQEQKSEFNRQLDVAEQPLIVLQSIKDGDINSKDITTFKTIYPALYSNISQKLLNEVIEQKSKGTDIPYHIKMGLSLFLGQPLDSTMTPQSILANQSQVPTKNTEEQNVPSKQMKIGQAKGLDKLSSLYKTDSQARLESKNRA